MNVSYDPCLMLYNHTSSALVLGQGSYGTVIRAPLIVKTGKHRLYAMKVWSYVLNYAPACKSATKNQQTNCNE